MSKIFIFFKIYLSLIQFDFQLKNKGFQSVFPVYVDKYNVNIKKLEPNKAYDDLIIKKVDQYLKLIDIACACYPRDAQCLHRSFLAFKFLRKDVGLPVDLIIGVRKSPFSAHAWVMYDGKSVNESIEYVSQFNILLSSAV
jgi:hypothetical protein